MTLPIRLSLLTVLAVFAPVGFNSAWAQALSPAPVGQPAPVQPYGGVTQPYGGLPNTRPAYQDGLDSSGLEPRVPPDATKNWIVTPYISLREAYTDNVRLAHDGKSSDFVTSATPGLAVQGQTRRLKTALDGNITYDAYRHSSDLDGYRYSFFGNGLGELVEDNLFLDARSSISAQQVTANGPNSSFDRSLAGNQVQVINNSISPYLLHDFGSWASGELRYRASMVEYSSANTNSQAQTPTAGGLRTVNLSNSTTNQILADLHAGPQFNIFRWAVDGSASNTDYENGRTIERNSTTLTGEYAVMRELALLAKVGEDSFKDSSLPSSDSSHPSWRLGARVTPGPRTDLLVEGGRRFGGPYWSGQFRYLVSRTITLTASHEESIGTQQEAANNGLNQLIRDDQGRLVDPLTGEVTNPNASSFSYVDQSYSLKSTRVGVTGVDDRNTYNLWTQYDQRSIGATALGQNGQERQNVFSLGGLVGRQLTRISDANLFVSVSRSEDSLATGGYDIFRAGTSYNYDFSPTLRGGLSYLYYRLNNEINTGYRENAILASARKSF